MGMRTHLKKREGKKEREIDRQIQTDRDRQRQTETDRQRALWM